MDKRILVIALIIFTNLVGVGLILPLLPYYAERTGASIPVIGFFAASYPLFAILSAPYLGKLSDKYGRRPILIFSLVGTVLGFFLLGFANSLPLLFLARIIDGASAGNVGSAQAYIADITSKEKRTQGLTFVTIAIAAGSLLGPVIGGFFSSWGLHAPASIAGVIGFLSLMLTVFFLPESKDFSINVEKKKLFIGINDIIHAIKKPIIGSLLLISFLIQLVFWMMLGTFAIYGEHFSHLTTQQVAYLFAYDALIGIIIQIISLSGIANPVITGLISKNSHEDDQGNVMGILGSIGSIASLLGPIVATAIYAGVNPRTTYYIAGTIGLIAVMLSLHVLSKPPQANAV